jgi:hypothetical protein
MNSTHEKLLQGSALVYALVIMTAVSIILTSILGFIVSQTKYSLHNQSNEQAFQIAESGINFYRWYLAHQVEGRTAQQIQTFWASGNPYGVATPYEVEYKDPEGAAVGKYRLTVTPPTPGSTIVTVKAEGWTYKYPNAIRTLAVRLRRPSWSESAVLANDFMRFGAGTEVFGKIISNKGIRFDGVAHNVISSAVASFDDPDHNGAVEFGVHTHVNAPPGSGVNDAFRAAEAPPAAVPARSDVFGAGRTFPVAAIDFNGVLGDLSLMKTAAQATATYFLPTGTSAAGKQIILKSNGTFDVCKVNTIDTGYSITKYARNVGGGTCGTCSGNCAPTNYPIPSDGVIFVEGNAWVSGTINNKKVSIVAADLLGGAAPSVYILNDIRYTNYNGNDIIGIIGQNNIEIAYASATTLRIDAALLAQQGRVGREHYSSPKGLTPDSKSSITIFGAMATNQRYGFAWTDNTGYTTRNLYYDNNLLYYPPPYFPTGTQYQMDLWEEK